MELPLVQPHPLLPVLPNIDFIISSGRGNEIENRNDKSFLPSSSNGTAFVSKKPRLDITTHNDEGGKDSDACAKSSTDNLP